jgi:hypothetical protein
MSTAGRRDRDDGMVKARGPDLARLAAKAARLINHLLSKHLPLFLKCAIESAPDL